MYYTYGYVVTVKTRLKGVTNEKKYPDHVLQKSAVFATIKHQCLNSCK